VPFQTPIELLRFFLSPVAMKSSRASKRGGDQRGGQPRHKDTAALLKKLMAAAPEPRQ
jgi:hypothetical protein